MVGDGKMMVKKYYFNGGGKSELLMVMVKGMLFLMVMVFLLLPFSFFSPIYREIKGVTMVSFLTHLVKGN